MYNETYVNCYIKLKSKRHNAKEKQISIGYYFTEVENEYDITHMLYGNCHLTNIIFYQYFLLLLLLFTFGFYLYFYTLNAMNLFCHLSRSENLNINHINHVHIHI